MSAKTTIVKTALVGALGAALALGATAAHAGDKEKCYGVAAAGENDCGNLQGTHSCETQASVDYDLGEWKLVDKGTCSSVEVTLDDGTTRTGLSKDEAKALLEA